MIGSRRRPGEEERGPLSECGWIDHRERICRDGKSNENSSFVRLPCQAPPVSGYGTVVAQIET